MLWWVLCMLGQRGAVVVVVVPHVLTSGDACALGSACAQPTDAQLCLSQLFAQSHGTTARVAPHCVVCMAVWLVSGRCAFVFLYVCLCVRVWIPHFQWYWVLTVNARLSVYV